MYLKTYRVKVSTVWFIVCVVFAAVVVIGVTALTPLLLANDKAACALTDNPDLCLKGRGWKHGGMNTPLDQG